MDQNVLSSYLSRIPPEKINRLYHFLDLAGEDVDIFLTDAEVRRAYLGVEGSSTMFNTVAFWKTVLAYHRQVPAHCVKLAQSRRDEEEVDAGRVAGIGPAARGEMDAGRVAVTPAARGEMDAGRVAEPADSLGENALGGPSDRLRVAEPAERGENAVGGPSASESDSDPYDTIIRGVRHDGEEQDSTEQDDELDFDRHDFRILVDLSQMTLQTDRNDCHKIKWHKLNSLAYPRVAEFFFLELYRDHVDFKSRTRYGNMLLLHEKSDILGLKNIERALYEFPSKVDAEMYACFLDKYPWKRASWNRGEFYRMTAE